MSIKCNTLISYTLISLLEILKNIIAKDLVVIDSRTLHSKSFCSSISMLLTEKLISFIKCRDIRLNRSISWKYLMNVVILMEKPSCFKSNLGGSAITYLN